MIETTYLSFSTIFKLGFIIGLLGFEFFMLLIISYIDIYRIKQYKEFLKRHKLLQKFEEEKEYYEVRFF